MKTKQRLATLILRLWGWEAKSTSEAHLLSKYVLVSGPHTSNWDFIIGKLAYMAVGIDGKFLIKKELFVWPLGSILRKMGGYPVNRKSPKGIVEIINQIKSEEKFVLAITPEGTRQKTKVWKDGFYSIAKKAQIPILVGSIDYSRRLCRIGDPFEITGNFNRDIEQLKRFYNPLYARHPENFAYHGDS